MKSQFSSLFVPIRVGRSLLLKNRLYFSPVGYDLCDSNGFPRKEFYKVYDGLIESGCGFGFLGNAAIENVSRYSRHGLVLTSQAHAEQLRPVFEAGSLAGIPVGAQLQHYGVQDPDNASKRVDGHIGALARSIDMLTDEDVYNYVSLFVNSAVCATTAGSRVLQIHAGNGYLLSSLLSPLTNKRTDRWGGSAIKRASALLEVVGAIRCAVDEGVTIFVRLQADDGYGEQGLRAEYVGEIAAALQEVGCDAVTLATGVKETFHKFMSDPDLTQKVSLKAGRAIKACTRMPVGFAGNVETLEQASQFIESGDIDFVGFARPLIADPKFVIKQLHGFDETIHRCRWDSFCLRDKKEPESDRMYCCVNPNMTRPGFLQERYENE